VTALSGTFGRLFDLLATLGSAILLAMVALGCIDILLRDAFGSGIAWVDEVSQYALYVIVLTAPWLLRRGQHVRIDIVLTLIPPLIAWLMEGLSGLAGFGVCVVLVRYGLSTAYDSWTTGSTTIKNLIFPK
jgi:TRAP-type transport system small permease protein